MNEEQRREIETLVFAEQKKVAETISDLMKQQEPMDAYEIDIARMPEKIK